MHPELAMSAHCWLPVMARPVDLRAWRVGGSNSALSGRSVRSVELRVDSASVEPASTTRSPPPHGKPG